MKRKIRIRMLKVVHRRIRIASSDLRAPVLRDQTPGSLDHHVEHVDATVNGTILQAVGTGSGLLEFCKDFLRGNKEYKK